MKPFARREVERYLSVAAVPNPEFIEGDRVAEVNDLGYSCPPLWS